MENISISDLNRMLHAIEYECAIRVKELRLEANEEYNRTKGELIVQRERDLEKEFLKRVAEAKSRERKEESKEKQAHRIKIEGLKAGLFEEIIQNVREEVVHQSFNSDLLESILSMEEEDDIIVYVNERDQNMTEEILLKRGIRYSIKRMPVEGMGGVIVCSGNGKKIWDNSFETRINIFIDKHANKINQMIFKE